jgi:hypothetical protein
MIELGHWRTNLILESAELPFGFIYLITNKLNGKKYFGKKQMKTVKKLKPLKGKKNKRHFPAETDWKTYTSSSNDLNVDILAHGIENFDFEIIRFCESRFELSYFEAKIQFDNDVLLRPGFYNGIINCRIGRAPKALLEKQ